MHVVFKSFCVHERTQHLSSLGGLCYGVMCLWMDVFVLGAQLYLSSYCLWIRKPNKDELSVEMGNEWLPSRDSL